MIPRPQHPPPTTHTPQPHYASLQRLPTLHKPQPVRHHVQQMPLVLVSTAHISNRPSDRLCQNISHQATREHTDASTEKLPCNEAAAATPLSPLPPAHNSPLAVALTAKCSARSLCAHPCYRVRGLQGKGPVQGARNRSEPCAWSQWAIRRAIRL